jgi:truncated hemoglobin YjbI
MKLKMLYDNLGEGRLRDILREFYQRMSKDVLIGYFFDGKDIQNIADQQFAFLLLAMGVRKTYDGKLPTHAHLNLPPIYVGHFDRRLTLLRKTLEDAGLKEEEINAWVDFEDAFRNVVITKQ